MAYLEYDQSNFILGLNKIDDGIGTLHTDTQEIIAVLKSAQQINGTRIRALTRAVQMAGYNANSAGRNVPPASRIAPIPPRRVSPSTESPPSSGRIRRIPPASNSASNSNSTESRANIRRIRSTDPSSDDSESRNTNNSTRQRDANGRFTSDNSGGGSNAGSNDNGRERDANGRFTGGSGGSGRNGRSGFNMPNMGDGNLNNIDPLIESYKELHGALAPLGKGAKFLFNGAKMGAGKLKAIKRREPLPIDQDRHNNENEKLLDKIWKAILNNNGGGGGRGLLGGLLGGAGGRGGRRGRGGGLRNLAGRGLRAVGGIKGLGAITALAGGAGLAMNWDELDHKGKSEGVGALAGGGAGALAGGAAGAAMGSIIPVVGTVAGGVVGAAIGGWIGSDAGEVLGGVASPYVQSWTQAMTAYNLPSKVEDVWTKGIEPFFTKMDEASTTLSKWASDQYKNFKNKVREALGLDPVDDGGGGGGGAGVSELDVSAGVTQKANKAADIITKNALTRSSGYCARYVRQGLQQAGYDLKTVGDAKNYNNGALTDAGFSKIDGNTTPQKGDIMVMPAQGKHKAGHIQMYNGKQWVSDFKQNSKNPWGDIASENLQYTMYRDQRGQMMAGTARSGKTGINGSKESKARIDQAMNYFTSQGWTKEQAAGIVGNLHKESGGFADDVVSGKRKGDSGKAVGIAQWHPDRQANFKKRYGKNLEGSSFAEQLAFVDYEMRHGTEKKAGNLLKKAKTAQQAGSIVSEYYERPANKQLEKVQRAQIADNILKEHGAAVTAPIAKATGKRNSNIAKNNTSLTSNIMPATSISGTMATTLPPIKPLMLPKAPQASQRIDSGKKDKPMMLQASNNENIPQNISDRALAHAVTGGLGEGLRWG